MRSLKENNKNRRPQRGNGLCTAVLSFFLGVMTGCNVLTIRDAPEAAQPNLEDLLSGQVILQGEDELRSEYIARLAELREFIVERITQNYLLPLNELYTGELLQCDIPNPSSSSYDYLCEIDFLEGEGHEVFEFAPPRRRFYALFYDIGLFEGYGIIEDSEYESLFYGTGSNFLRFSRTEQYEELEIEIFGLGRKLYELGIYGKCPQDVFPWGDYNFYQDRLIIARNENGFSIRFPDTLSESWVDDLAQQELASLSDFLILPELVKSRYGIANWLENHQEELQQYLEDLRHRAEQRRQEEARRLRVYELTPEFTAEIRAREGDYSRLIEREEFEPFFATYPNIAQFSNVRTSITSPLTLNESLEFINVWLGYLPVSYQELFSDINVYLTDSYSEIRTLCRWEHAGACYNEGTNTMYLPSFVSRDTFTHEMAHAIVDSLPRRSRRRLERIIEPIVTLPEMQNDVVRSEDSRQLVLSWGNDQEGPRYVCPTSYCASDTNEFIAEYAEDIFADNSRGIITLLQTANDDEHIMIVTAIDALAEYGLLGNAGETIAMDIYQSVARTSQQIFGGLKE